MKMDETTYEILEEKIMVTFDVRNEASCYITLEFTKDDALNIINMNTFGKEKLEVEGIEGFAVLSRRGREERNIAFSYKKHSVNDIGNFSYSYDKIVTLLEKAFTQLNSKKR